MNVQIVNAVAGDRPLLWSLLQEYLDELAPFSGSQNEEGVFSYSFFDLYWHDESRHAYLIYCNQTVAGFALVNSHVLDPASKASIAEFSILLPFRRQAVGLTAARSLLNSWKGRWEAKVQNGNSAALAFWKTVFSEGQDYRMVTIPDGTLISAEF